MATIEITKTNFARTVEDTDILLLDVWAPWCPPCRAFGPIFEDISEQHPDVVFGKVNADEEQELAALFKVRSIPTVLALRAGVVLFNQAGLLNRSQLNQVITSILAIDMDTLRTGP